MRMLPESTFGSDDDVLRPARRHIDDGIFILERGSLSASSFLVEIAKTCVEEMIEMVGENGP